MLSEISCALGSGEALLITGPNGAGKSTLLRLMAGLLSPLAGSITVEGSIGLADSHDALDRDMPLARALSFWTQLYDTAQDDSTDIIAALDIMGIAHLAQIPVRMLSSGQLQRGALARVIAGGTDIWLLDEPSNALDDDGVSRLEAAIGEHRAGGGIVVVASHLSLKLPNVQQLVLGS